MEDAISPLGRTYHGNAFWRYQRAIEQNCHDQVGKTEYEGEGRSGSKLQAQCLSECMQKG
jgi:hypothetical protein